MILRAIALPAAALLFAGSCSADKISDARTARAQLAELNHGFAVVDPLTADAIAKSDFLRDFANLQIRTTTGTRATWTGRYLYGKETYVEFFGPGDFSLPNGPAPIGSWGIALSGDRTGANKALAAAIESGGQKAFVEKETRTFGDKVVPWFEALTAISQHGDSGDLAEDVTVWAMEYDPAYFVVPEAGKEPPEHAADTISRERYQSDAFATRMMRDVVYLHFDVGPSDLARIEPLLQAAGYRIARSDREVRAYGEESSFLFTVVDTDARRLRQVRFALNGPAERRVERIGLSTLTVGPGTTATWIFDASP